MLPAQLDRAIEQDARLVDTPDRDAQLCFESQGIGEHVRQIERLR